jgi:Tfp pilus assembly protein PilF
MKARTILFVGGAALTLAACSRSNAAIEVRAKPAPPSAQAKALPLRIAEAHAQLALGNLAMASESYRKALRDDPQSLAALVGLASTYDQMGRHDLSRSYYEIALALAPDSLELLGALAASLERQGKPDDARAVRQEMAARSSAAGAPPAGAPENAPVPVGPSTPAAGITAPPDTAGPRLERVSPQEVVLVTDEEETR